MGAIDWHPSVKNFLTLIESDVDIRNGFRDMFSQTPADPTGPPPKICDYMTMLMAFDKIIRSAPTFEQPSSVGIPITNILGVYMGTASGVALLSNAKVNAQFKRMFEAWTIYLNSPESCNVLTTANNGWFGVDAMAKMPNFAETFVCEPESPFFGFRSWDNFFTRLFREGLRPVQSPERNDVINAACESTVYRIAYSAQASDKYWLKGQPYSINDMFDNDDLSEKFAGATVFQGFLSCLSYHRWHSPVNGRIIKTVMVDGTYFTQAATLETSPPDFPKIYHSQAFLASKAARALIFIDADGPIGLMCFMAVGMVEVSSCEIKVKPGARVNKGDELGTFHYGGSSHCLIFRAESNIVFAAGLSVETAVQVNSAIAFVKG